MFDITSLQADGDNNVYSFTWSYTTAAGSRSGSMKMPEAYGAVPVASITKANILAWVSANLPDDVTAQLDAQIAKDNAAALIQDVAVPD